MDRRVVLLGRRVTARALLIAALLVIALAAALPAQAQTPRIAISEVAWEMTGTDRTREYVEIANLGDQPWDPNNHWVFRWRERDDDASITPQLWVRIHDVEKVAPGDVLVLEWGRPLDDDDDNLDTACTSGPRFFCTAREGFNNTDLDVNMSLAIFAPTNGNVTPTMAEGTMLAYYLQYGDWEQPAFADADKEATGYKKAVDSKLWSGGPVLPKIATDWARALRMAPYPYPADHGRKGSDYYNTLAGYLALDQDNMTNAIPNPPPPNTPNRPGTPGQPNYLHPGRPLPGHLENNFWAVRVQAFPVSLAQNAPPAAMQVVALGNDGRVATSIFSNNTWSPLTPLAGVQDIQGAIFVNNPTRTSRTLVLTGKEGAVSVSTAAGDQPFGAAALANVKAQFSPVAVVDAAGSEHILAVEAGTGNILHGVIAEGKLGAFQQIPGATTNAPVAAAFATDSGLAVLSWKENQLVLYRLGADGKFGAGVSVGSAFGDRPAGVAPTLIWNPQAKRLEVIAATGAADALEVQHARIEVTASEAKVGTLTKIEGIGTDAPAAIAVNPETGQIRMLVRGGGKEPGLNASPVDARYDLDPDPGAPQSGFVFELTFDGSAWSAPKRVGLGRLPGPSPATPQFTSPVPPETIFDPNTKKFQDFLIGEDGQTYHNAVP